MKIDGDGELGGDNRFVDIGNDEDISYVDNLSCSAIYPTPRQDSKGPPHKDSNINPQSVTTRK